MTAIRPIDAAAFAEFGEVLPAIDAPDRAALVFAWAEWAERSFGAPVQQRQVAVKAAGVTLSVIEIHENSPQLTVSFEVPWVLAVLPRDMTSMTFDSLRLQAFQVPPLIGVVLRPNLWHGVVAPVRDAEMLVVFREGRVDDWTSLETPVPWDLAAGTIG
jgi:ureidoglycolate hydrolase